MGNSLTISAPGTKRRASRHVDAARKKRKVRQALPLPPASTDPVAASAGDEQSTLTSTAFTSQNTSSASTSTLSSPLSQPELLLTPKRTGQGATFEPQELTEAMHQSKAAAPHRRQNHDDVQREVVVNHLTGLQQMYDTQATVIKAQQAKIDKITRELLESQGYVRDLEVMNADLSRSLKEERRTIRELEDDKIRLLAECAEGTSGPDSTQESKFLDCQSDSEPGSLKRSLDTLRVQMAAVEAQNRKMLEEVTSLKDLFTKRWPI